MPRFPASWERELGHKLSLRGHRERQWQCRAPTSVLPGDVHGQPGCLSSPSRSCWRPAALPLGPAQPLLRGQAGPRSWVAVPWEDGAPLGTGAEPDTHCSRDAQRSLIPHRDCKAKPVPPLELWSFRTGSSLELSLLRAASAHPAAAWGRSFFDARAKQGFIGTAGTSHKALEGGLAPKHVWGGSKSEVAAQGCPDAGESRGAAASQGDECCSDFSLRPFYISLRFSGRSFILNLYQIFPAERLVSRDLAPALAAMPWLRPATGREIAHPPQPSPPALIHH